MCQSLLRTFWGASRARREGWCFLFFLFCLKFKTRGYVSSSIGVLLNIVEQETIDRLALERYI